MALGMRAVGVIAAKSRTLPVGYPAAIPIIGPYWRAEDLTDANGTSIASLPNHIDTEPFPLVQATGANQPTVVTGYAPANGKRVLNFPGTTQYMEATGLQVQAPYDFWILLQRIAFNTGDFYFEVGNTTLSAYAQDQAATNFRIVFGGATFNFTVPAGGAASALMAFRVQVATGTNASSVTYNNGAPTVGTINTVSALATRFILAAKIGGTLNPNIAFVEAFFLRGTPTAAEIATCWAYWRNYYNAPIA